MKQYFIYKITNPIGGVYIGKTTDLKRRLRSHQYKNHYKKSPLMASVREHGWDRHSVDVIDEFIGDEKHADDKEMFWIRSHMSNRSKWPNLNGFNLTDGGSGCLGHIGPYKGQKRPDGTGEAISRGKFKKVNQYSADGTFIAQHESGLHAAKALGVTNKMISAAALGKRITCKGYILKYD